MLKMLGTPFWARWGIVILLFLSGAAPLHLADEVHAALPTSASHHEQMHCETSVGETSTPCAHPHDDVSQPLSGEHHQRHHEVKCASDGAFLWLPNPEAVSGALTQWHVFALEFVAPSAVSLPEIAATSRAIRGPPSNAAPRSNPSSSPFSGRAPPSQA
ncbi:hypothetical protein [Abditibacterium utsteinense]|nr:hypothetical protein [Abditibacterium utsteinense]